MEKVHTFLKTVEDDDLKRIKEGDIDNHSEYLGSLNQYGFDEYSFNKKKIDSALDQSAGP